MLAKKFRLKRVDFPTVLKSRSSLHSPHFLLRILPGVKTAKMAVSVSKKVSKHAVVRNTIRRRTYAALRNHMPTSGAYLFVAKPGAEKVRGTQLHEEIVSLLNNAHTG